MEKRHEITKALNKILHFLNDSATCFKYHVSNVNKHDLSKLFEECYSSRKEMMMDIQDELLRIGQIASIRGTILGKVHMIFENIKSYLTGGDALAITKEVRRGESVLIDYYKQALTLPLPVNLKSLLIKHLNKIEDDIKKSDMTSIQ